ncbi:hypothetical protein P152DRAFT_487593 [Eremomyces bilateralis CBS 781.70]|uniref:Rhodopsin domain-containing protein n=1 Tax=Eremomyces bilateralis CBS 781.70 TaxID=1392243 RepID=A0A6G1G2C5_9PEZI|nr:uncharacterized protein P152DRAFT_487593 [Eremomyces bilateralis CBS 781.70]KAF1812168.1 hypothetical protein P152DRAFT_487593 [Eremomyces bilateralis CBS 781.70]
MASVGDAVDVTRFSPITEFDKAGIVWILALLGGVYTLLTLFVRWFIKRDTFGSDDWTFVGTTLFAVGAFLPTYIALSRGLAKSESILSERTLITIGRIGRPYLTSQIFFILTIALAKCSVILLIRRLFSLDMESHRRWCHIMLVVVSVWGLASVLALSIDCGPRQVLGIGGSFCSNQYLRWQLVGAFDAITELLTFCLSFALIHRLQMKLHLRVRVILAFVFRVPLIAIAILNIHLVQGWTTSLDPGVAIAAPLVCQLVELAYSLISATIPNLKSFLMSFDTAWMMEVGTSSKPIPYSNQTPPEEYQLDSFPNSPRHAPGLSGLRIDPEHLTLRPESLEHIAAVQHPASERTGSREGSFASTNSRERIIRCEHRWKIQYGQQPQDGS